jgi:hypothetical protein
MGRVGVGVGFGEQARVSSYVAPLGMDRFLGCAHMRILRSRSRYSLAAAVGVAERNRNCNPVGNEQRTIRLTAAAAAVVVVVDLSYWNTRPGHQEHSNDYPGIYVSPRPYGGFELVLIVVG